MSLADVTRLPAWTWVAPVAAAVLLAAKFSGVLAASAAPVLAIAALLLGAAVFASVHHAEIIALRVGEPYGSIVLALAVTVIESSLILSLMLAGAAGSEVLARDTVFATVMLVLTGIVGLCLVVGGMRHREQTFGTDAAAAALSVLGTLAVVTLVLPNFALGAVGPYYSAMQLLFVGVVSVSLYAVFLFVQTIRHREYFLDAAAAGTGDLVHDTPHDTPHAVPSNRITSASVALLALSLVGVVLLAKTLSPALERAIAIAGLPPAFSGVVIAAIVLMPESIAAVRSARANRLQSSLNLALGSALATIGLTIPIVGIAALWLEQPLALGIGAAETVLLLLTLFISTVTLATGRTTILQGAVHLVIFAVFMLLAIVQ